MGKKGAVAAAIVVVAIIVIIGGAMAAIEFDSPILEDEFDMFSGNTFGEVRNCIRSVLGNEPECSDYSERIMPTTCNGRSLGDIPYSEAKIMCA